MKTISADKLFTPIQVGPMELKHRMVMSPLTRSRSVQPGSIPGDLMLEYYSQRVSDGGLIVSEGTSISIAGGGWFGAPGFMGSAGTCSPNCGIPGVLRMWPRGQTARSLF